MTSVVDITSAGMARHAFHRYSVTHNGTFLGEVFQFRPFTESTTVQWLAQDTEGHIRGLVTHLHTRKAAVAVLVLR